MIGSLYAVWLIYAAGLQYLLMAVLFLALGVPVFVWARRENAPNEPAFKGREPWAAGALIIAALIAVFLFSRGVLPL